MADEKSPGDLLAKPVSFLLAWGIPGLILFFVNFLDGYIPHQVIVLVIAGMFAWMGMGCVLNARRCHRRHCYYSGPIFLLGAVAVLLVGYEGISLGPDGLITIVWGTFALVALTFVSEIFWGKYVTR